MRLGEGVGEEIGARVLDKGHAPFLDMVLRQKGVGFSGDHVHDRIAHAADVELSRHEFILSSFGSLAV